MNWALAPAKARSPILIQCEDSFRNLLSPCGHGSPLVECLINSSDTAYNVATNNEVVANANCLKRPLEKIARSGRAKILKPVIVAEGAEAKTAGLVITNKPRGHASILLSMSRRRDMGQRPLRS